MKRKERKMGLFIIGAFVGMALTIFGLFLTSLHDGEYSDGVYEEDEE